MNVPSQLNRSFDLLVIGSGAAGGDCPNYACVPTKALLRSAKIYALLKRAAAFGLRAGAVKFEWAKVLARKEWIVRHTGAATAKQQY